MGQRFSSTFCHHRFRPVLLVLVLVLVLALGDTALHAAAAEEDAAAWKREALERLGDYGDNVVKRNERITQVYWDLYELNPRLFLWAKAGAIASEKIGSFLFWFPWWSKIVPLDRAKQLVELQDLRDLMAAGNIAVYEDIAWQFLAYHQGGFAAITRAHEHGDITDLQYQAWTQIEQASQKYAAAEVEEAYRLAHRGAVLLFQHEQVLLQGLIYQPREQLWKSQSSPDRHFGWWFREVRGPFPRFPEDASLSDLQVRLDWGGKWIDVALKGPDRRQRRPLDELSQSSRSYPPFFPPGGGAGGAVLVSPFLSTPRAGPAGKPGGIDFSAVDLRYLSASSAPDAQTLAYAFRASKARPGEPTINVRAATAAAVDALFVWLTVPRETFWVNLNPNEPDRILDDRLRTTDVGRIMLEADLQMKKTVAALIDPSTARGRFYWRQLEAVAASDQCTAFRQWIVPGRANVWATNDSVYVAEATLDVKLESEYLKVKGEGEESPSSGCRANEQAEALFTRTVLPRLVDAVNNSAEYAALRSIYHARIIAEWFARHQDSGAAGTLAQAIGLEKRSVENLRATRPWSPREIFDQYVKSVRDGEFNISYEEERDGYLIRRTYFFGGVDFKSIDIKTVSDTELLSTEPALEEQLFDAVATPTGYKAANEVWLGGVNAWEPNRSWWEELRFRWDRKWLPILAALGSLLVVSLTVRRRRRTPTRR